MTDAEIRSLRNEIERLRMLQADRFEEKHKDGCYETSKRIKVLQDKLNREEKKQ